MVSVVRAAQSRARTIVVVFLLAVGCAKSIAQLQLGAENTKSVFVINYGWHSAIILKKVDISELILPESKDFAQSEYLEFGWGDADFYQDPDPGLGLALKAAFWSSGSVLHVGGLSGTLGKSPPSKDIVEIALSQKALQRLSEFISATFARPPAETRPGLYPDSRFYSANGKFHIFRNCNTWVAEALRAAGLPISGSIVTAGGLMHEAKQLTKAEKDYPASWGAPESSTD
jgi:uncharacterized protein (TIGR02117 family)